MSDLIETDGARATLYRKGPSFNGRRTAAIGKFRCDSADAGRRLLHDAVERLTSERFEALIGPMDGDTWHSYRLVTQSDGSPAFLMEPTSAEHDLQAFQSAAFDPVFEYVSARQPLMAVERGNLHQDDDIVIDAWDGEDPEALFSEVHALSLQAFRNNPFYQPLALADFLSIYMPMVPLIRRELIFFARDAGGAMVGFFFALPDYQQGPQPKDVIFKTYASLVRGVGRRLVDHAVHASAALGFENAIHALMHDANPSANRSDRIGGKIFRRYALMGRLLDG